METFNNFFTNKNTDLNLFKEKEIPSQDSQIYKPRFKNFNNDEEINDYNDNNRGNNYFKFKESKNSISLTNKMRSKGLYDTKPADPKFGMKLNPKVSSAKTGNSKGNDNGGLSKNQTSIDFWQIN